MANEVQSFNPNPLNSVNTLHSRTKYEHKQSKISPKEDIWDLKKDYINFYLNQFLTIQPDYETLISGSRAKLYFKKSGLTTPELSKIWRLSDGTKDGALSIIEFIIAMHLIVVRKNGYDIPDSLPLNLYPQKIKELLNKFQIIPLQTPNEESSKRSQNRDRGAQGVVPRDRGTSGATTSQTSIRRSKTLPLNAPHFDHVVRDNYRDNYDADDHVVDSDGKSKPRTMYMPHPKPWVKIVVEKKQLRSWPDTLTAGLYPPTADAPTGAVELPDTPLRPAAAAARQPSNQNQLLVCLADDADETFSRPIGGLGSVSGVSKLNFTCFVPTTASEDPNDGSSVVEGESSRNGAASGSERQDGHRGSEDRRRYQGGSSMARPANFDFLPALPFTSNGVNLHHPVAIKGGALDDHEPLVTDSDEDDEDYSEIVTVPVQRGPIGDTAAFTSTGPSSEHLRRQHHTIIGSGSSVSDDKVVLAPSDAVIIDHRDEPATDDYGDDNGTGGHKPPLPPPFPLPRSKHGRSASLDLNKLFAKTDDGSKPTTTITTLLPPVIPPRLSSPNSQAKKKVDFCVDSAPHTIPHQNGPGQNVDFECPAPGGGSLSDEAKSLIHQRTCSLDRKMPPSFAVFEGGPEPKQRTADTRLPATSYLDKMVGNVVHDLISHDTTGGSKVIENGSVVGLEDATSRHKAHNYLLMRLNAKLNREKWKLTKRKMVLEGKLEGIKE